MNRIITYTSERGIPLLMDSPRGHVPDSGVLTVEAYPKWYDLYLVTKYQGVFSVFKDYATSEIVTEAEDAVLSLGESAYCDHAYNPRFFLAVAKALGVCYSSLAYEMVVGRWEMDYIGNKSKYYDGE